VVKKGMNIIYNYKINLYKMTYYFESDEMLCEYMLNHSYEVNEYIFEKIKNYILENNEINYLTLFYYGKDSITLNVDIEISDNKDKLIKPLNICLSKFEEIEDYERCSECLKLINNINI
jgi:hypothetical protein